MSNVLHWLPLSVVGQKAPSIFRWPPQIHPALLLVSSSAEMTTSVKRFQVKEELHTKVFTRDQGSSPYIFINGVEKAILSSPYCLRQWCTWDAQVGSKQGRMPTRHGAALISQMHHSGVWNLHSWILWGFVWADQLWYSMALRRYTTYSHQRSWREGETRVFCLILQCC